MVIYQQDTCSILAGSVPESENFGSRISVADPDPSGSAFNWPFRIRIRNTDQEPEHGLWGKIDGKDTIVGRLVLRI